MKKLFSRENSNRRKHGMTLIELVVGFALAAIIMSVIVCVVPMYVSVYGRNDTMIEQRQIADTLLDKISYLLSTCNQSYTKENGESDPSTIAIKVARDNKSVSVLSYGGLRQDINAADGYLHVIYTVDTNTTDWHYGSEFYSGSTIMNISFIYLQNDDESNPIVDSSLIKVTITLTHGADGPIYTQSSIVDCHTDNIKQLT